MKLVNTHRGRKAVYACLSYSWGKANQHCTTTRNIKSHIQQIRISDLPHTVADAIKLCRCLEIPYLWVDALCIVQDDKDDWNREAAAMASIYGSSVLTISTTNTSACSENFLKRNFDEYPSVQVDWIHGPSGIMGTVHLVSDWPGDHGSLLSNSPWMQRGWTLQEWMLSPRILHCGSTETAFDCLYGIRYESNPDEMQQSVQTHGAGRAVDLWSPRSRPWETTESLGYAKIGPTDASTAREHHRVDEVEDMKRIFERVTRMEYRNGERPGGQSHAPGPEWAHVVAQFCTRHLTKDTDKLPALAGLAARFQAYHLAMKPEQEYIYLAGLWWTRSPAGLRPRERAELPAGLLWRKTGDTDLVRPAAYRAPSWSWAALDGPVKFLEAVPDEFKLQIHDAACVCEYSGSFSSVRDGWIDAEGLLRRVWTVEVRGNIEIRITERQEEAGNGHEWHVCFDEKVSGPRWKEIQRLELFILLVARDCSSSRRRVTNHALLLKRVAAEKGCQIDCFTRLGIARRDVNSQKGSMKEFEHQLDEQEDISGDWELAKLRLR